MKQCNICNAEKDFSEFYVNKGMKDGYQNRCIQCTKIKVREREAFLRLDPDWVEKDKERHREKYHRLNYKEKHKPSPEKKKEIIARYKGKYPEKHEATKKASHLPRTEGNDLHHWSYNEQDWLDVIELSIKDHNLLHRNMIYDDAVRMYRNKQGILLDCKQSHIDLLNQLKTYESKNNN